MIIIIIIIIIIPPPPPPPPLSLSLSLSLCVRVRACARMHICQHLWHQTITEHEIAKLINNCHYKVCIVGQGAAKFVSPHISDTIQSGNHEHFRENCSLHNQITS